MKRTIAISMALLACSAWTAAQAVDQYHAQTFSPQAAQSQPLDQYHLQKFNPQAVQSHFWTILNSLRPEIPSGCPVLFNAKQGWDGGLVAAGAQQTPKQGFSQRIRLSQTGGDVIAARVTVHGLTPKTRVVPAQFGAPGPGQISRTMNVSFSGDSAGESAADLLMRGYSAVFSIDVESITYADGSTWRSGAGVCRVIPDPVMLISAR